MGLQMQVSTVYLPLAAGPWLNFNRDFQILVSTARRLFAAGLWPSHRKGWCAPITTQMFLQELLHEYEFTPTQWQIILAARAQDTVEEYGLSWSRVALALKNLYQDRFALCFKTDCTFEDVGRLLALGIRIALNWQWRDVGEAGPKPPLSPFDDGHYSWVSEVSLPNAKIRFRESHHKYLGAWYPLSHVESLWWDEDEGDVAVSRGIHTIVSTFEIPKLLSLGFRVAEPIRL